MRTRYSTESLFKSVPLIGSKIRSYLKIERMVSVIGYFFCFPFKISLSHQDIFNAIFITEAADAISEEYPS